MWFETVILAGNVIFISKLVRTKIKRIKIFQAQYYLYSSRRTIKAKTPWIGLADV